MHLEDWFLRLVLIPFSIESRTLKVIGHADHDREPALLQNAKSIRYYCFDQ